MSHEVSVVDDLFFVNQILPRSPEEKIIESFRKGGGRLLVTPQTGQIRPSATLSGLRVHQARC